MMNELKKISTVPIYGIHVCKWGMSETVQYLTDAILLRVPHQVITANPIMVMTALDDPSYMSIMRNAELVVPDGTGVVWAAAKVGQPVQERVAGFDLLHEMLRVGENYQWKVYLLGSSQEVIQETASRLQIQYPGIVIVGYHDGFFGPNEDDTIIQNIQALSPDILFVARASDTQEPWIARHKEKLAVPLMMGVGGSFDVISGKTKRAPRIFQNFRAEWLYRLLREPTRYRRMLMLPQFVVKVLRDKDNVTKVT